MASLDSLAADQRAVLALVLRRERGYDEIARLLSVDRGAVRGRALAAADALGPETVVPRERRALITDYLLGQLPSRVAAEVLTRLADSPDERAWAHALASELAIVSAHPLPELPPAPESAPAEAESAPAEAEIAPAEAQTAPAEAERAPSPAGRARATSIAASQRGLAVVIGLAVVVLAAILLIFLLTDSSKPKQAAAPASTTAAKSTTTVSSTASAPTGVQVLGEISLTSPTAASTVGVAQVLRQGNTSGIVIRAENVPPNTRHDAYAVWLYNSAGDAHLLGFVSRQVGSDGNLSTAGPLPPNLPHYKELIVTRETLRNPKHPGKIVLRGRLTGIS